MYIQTYVFYDFLHPHSLEASVVVSSQVYGWSCNPVRTLSKTSQIRPILIYLNRHEPIDATAVNPD